MKPKVTVAIVCYNEEKNIAQCLNSVLNQSYDRENYEILVVDNGSTDQTEKIIKDLQKKTGRIRLVVNLRLGIAISRNVALRQAQGQLLAFTDADCVVPKNWLKTLVAGYSKYHSTNSKVICVGGPNRPPQTTAFYQALGLVLNTFLGSRGSVQARQYLDDRFVSHLPCVNVLYDKDKIRQIGGFDEKFGSISEDEDLSFRLRQKGFQFVYLAQAGLVHKMRADIWAWAKNMFIYGKGRVWFLEEHPEVWHFLFLLPIGLVLLAPIMVPIYLAIIFVYSFWVVARARKLNLWLATAEIYFATHFFYGIGEIYGLFKKRPL